MITIPEREPTELRAGTVWEWTRTDLAQDYPASIWTLKYSFKNQFAHFELEAVESGDDFFISVEIATTANIAGGNYQWVAYVEEKTLAIHRHDVGFGTIDILPLFTGTNVYDGRSDARQIRDSLLEAIKKFAQSNGAVKQYQIGDRMMMFSDGGDLLKQFNFWDQKVKAEEAADRLKRGQSGSKRLLAQL